MASRVKRVLCAVALWATLISSPALAAANLTTEGAAFAAVRQIALDPTAAQQWARSQVSARDGDALGPHVGLANWVIAQIKFRQGDVHGAARYNRAARGIARAGGDRRLLAYCDVLDALIARSSNDYGEALQLLREAQQTFIALQDRRGHGVTLQTMSTIYNDVREWEASLALLQQATAVYRGDAQYDVVTTNNRGVALEGLNRLKEAEQAYTAAERAAERAGLPAVARRAQLNLVNLHVFAGNLRAAVDDLARFDRAQGESLISPEQVAPVRSALAFARGDAANAERLLLLDQDASSANAIHKLMLGYRISKALGREKDALERLERANEMSEEEARTIARNRAALLAAQFQFSAQEARLAQLRAQALERDLQYQRRLTWILLLSTVALTLAMTLYLRNLMRARSRAEADGARLTDANRHLELALAARSRFLAATSHELRTPLNGILGMAQVMGADTALASRHREQVGVIEAAGNAMRALVDDILDVAKIEDGGLSLHPVPTDLRALAEGALSLMADVAQTRGLSVTLHVGPELGSRKEPQLLMLDPGRVSQLLLNLIGNAIKFTEDGEVTVTISKVSDRVEIAVRDTGIGIPYELQRAVFEPFRQVDSGRTRAHGGTGLGLAITRSLVEAMGGEIRLESVPSEGSCFTIWLPWIAATGSATADAKGVAAGHVRSVSFSPNPMRAALLHAALESCDPETVRVASASDLIERFGHHPIMLVTDAQDWPALAANAGEAAALWHVVCVAPETQAHSPPSEVTPLPVRGAAASVTSASLSKRAIAQHWSRFHLNWSILDLPDEASGSTAIPSADHSPSVGGIARRG